MNIFFKVFTFPTYLLACKLKLWTKIDKKLIDDTESYLTEVMSSSILLGILTIYLSIKIWEIPFYIYRFIMFL